MDKYIIRTKPKEKRNSEEPEDCRPSTSGTSSSVSPSYTVVPLQEDVEIQSENEQPPTKKKKYMQNFRTAWSNEFKYLQCVNQIASCRICDKKLACNYNHIQRHFNSKTHQIKENSLKSTPSISQFVDPGRVNLNNSVKAAELKLLVFLHEHNLPFLLMDHLPKLITSAFPDSTIAKTIEIGRTKATSLTKNQLVEESLTELKSLLQINNFYSLIIDETTDISTQKSLAVVIRFHDEISIRDRFFGLIRVEDASANGLFSAVIKLLNDNDIPVENMIGFAADNASVMMGNKIGVQSRFKEINPNIIIMGCICHSLHLCSSAAALKLPKSVEEFLRNILNHFSNSSKRIENFKEYQEFVDIKPLKLLKTSQTRWLSLQAAVERVLQSWDALKLYFTNAVYTENLKNTSSILENLNNPIYKIYFCFLSYSLGFVNNLNKEFQSESCKIDVVLVRMTELFKTFLRNYIKKEYIDKTPVHELNVEDPHQFIKMEKMYFGAKVEQIIGSESLNENELLKFRTNALGFYIELCKQIKKRIDFNDPLLNFLKFFSPKEIMSGDHLSITKILDYFPQLIPHVDVENLNAEYRLVSSVKDLEKKINCNFEIFWNSAKEMKNGLDEPMFPNLWKVIKVIMTIPHSSAAAERIFSQLTLMKTKQRNRLEVDTCDSIMHVKSLLDMKGGHCYEFEPSKRLLKKVS